MSQNSAIQNLATLEDTALFEQVAIGVSKLHSNLTRLEAAARQLFESGDQLSAAVLRHFATEEAAKILILLDAVRCSPSDSDACQQTLKRWNSHIWKGIYAQACSWSPVDFNEVSGHVERDLQTLYLDGPFDVDWIFPNKISTQREWLIYVDYVYDLTKDIFNADKWWETPDEGMGSLHYGRDTCVKTVLALLNAGVGTAKGLRVVAEVWRDVKPDHNPSRTDIGGNIFRMYQRLQEQNLVNEHWSDGSKPAHLLNWPFPLWSLANKPEQNKKREELLEERDEMIERIAEIEADREPPPAISEEQVLRMHEAYLDRKAAEDQRSAELDKKPRRDWAGFPRTLSSSDMDFIHDVNAPEYLRLRDMWRNLSREEQIALLALAWFTRHNIEDWPHDYQDAKERFDGVEEHYHLGCAHEWLEGYRRWKGEQIHPWRLPSV